MNFQFRPILTIASIIALAILIMLGQWQVQRLHWKNDLIAKTEARVNAAPIPLGDALARAAAGEDMEYTPVTIAGIFTKKGEAKLFGLLEGAPGHYLFTLLEQEGPRPAPIIYVNRGFVPQAVDVVSAESQPAGVSGLLRYRERLAPPASWFRTSEKTADGFWHVRDPALFAAHEGFSAPPYYIDSFEDPGNEWPKGGTTRLDFTNRHLEYALTWFGLAATLVGVWLCFSLRRSSRNG